MLTGPNGLPSVGPFRFLWVYLLVGAIVLLDRKKRQEGAWNEKLLVLGCVGWTLGTLWSLEGAIFASCCWLPAYAWMVRGKSRNWLFLPGALFLAAWGSVWLFYFVRLGHGPDLQCFIEYSMSYASGFGALPISLDGAVAELLMVFALLLVFALRCWQEDRESLPVALALLGAFWSTSVYFVGRSHENNISNLMPIQLLVLGALLARLESVHLSFRRWVESAVVPVFVIVLFACADNPVGHREYFESLGDIFRGIHEINAHQPPPPPESVDLLRRAGYSLGDPLVYFGTDLARVPSATSSFELAHPWIPVAPASEYSILSRDRQLVYLTRYLNLHPTEVGWVMELKQIADSNSPLYVGPYDLVANPSFQVHPTLETAYRITKIAESENLRVLKYERTGSPAVAAVLEDPAARAERRLKALRSLASERSDQAGH
jgi:hypothetical protein